MIVWALKLVFWGRTMNKIKRSLFYQTLFLPGGVIIFLVGGWLNQFSYDALAQEPATTITPTSGPASSPTVVIADTATPEPSPTAGVPTAPTPWPTATAARIVKFSVDAENGEINLGQCVLFSWVVRGDIAWVEFDQDDDDKDPILVADTAERKECPARDADYKLKVTWLDNTTFTREIDIEVDTSQSSSSGDSGSSAGSAGNADVPASGPFVAVTPILFQDISLAPSGVLVSINSLPETGLSPVGSLPEKGREISRPVLPQHQFAPIWYLLGAAGMAALLGMGIRKW
jgi:hypothetical protein